MYGVPQGSTLGPKAFKRYSRAVSSIIRKYQLDYQIYADDIQIYTYFSPDNPSSQRDATERIQACVTEIKCWMTDCYLKLNEEKTEVIVISKKTQGATSTMSVDIAGHQIVPSTFVRNLGVIVDSTACMDKQINNICKSAFYMLRNISRIRRYLTNDAAKSLVHSFVSTKLDYCNSLLYGLPKCQLNKMQRVLNCAARVVARVGRNDHITGILISLHWLPVCERIEFKILLLTFKALHGLAPKYLTCLIHVYTPVRPLRSVNSCTLTVPTSCLKRYGDRAFVHCAPILWNRLPHTLRAIDDIVSFKRDLKTFLFKRAL